MNAAWGGICSSTPPCIAVSIRSATYSHGNIIEKMAFTINVASEKYIKEADYFGMVSGRNENKFIKTRLTPVKSDFIDAPYIEEFPLVIECKVIQIVEIGIHTQFIGEILDIKADEKVLGQDSVDIKKIMPLIFSTGDRCYYAVGEKLGDAFSVGKDI